MCVMVDEERELCPLVVTLLTSPGSRFRLTRIEFTTIIGTTAMLIINYNF